MREAWTDDRLDDLNRKVETGFQRMERRFERLEDEMDARFERLEERLEARFDSLNRTLFLFSGSMIVALFGVIAAVA